MARQAKGVAGFVDWQGLPAKKQHANAAPAFERGFGVKVGKPCAMGPNAGVARMAAVRVPVWEARTTDFL